jgi:hypothetical protein
MSRETNIANDQLNGMDVGALREANHAFKDQVSGQISRITAELRRMEDLLKFGMVDRRVLSEFRSAIDRVRTTGWQVERWLDRDERGLDVLLTEERIRLVTRMATQLASESSLDAKSHQGFRALQDAIGKLHLALEINE